jgi:hypothetical protein
MSTFKYTVRHETNGSLFHLQIRTNIFISNDAFEKECDRANAKKCKQCIDIALEDKDEVVDSSCTFQKGPLIANVILNTPKDVELTTESCTTIIINLIKAFFPQKGEPLQISSFEEDSQAA